MYVTGQACSEDFPVTLKAFATSLNGDCDAFMARVDTSMTGQALLAYATYLGGSGSDRGLGIALHPSSEVFVTGETESVDFPTRGGPFQAQHGGGIKDVFLARLAADSANTNTGCEISLLMYNDCPDLRYSTFLGGSGDDFGAAVAVDIAGAAYVTGQTCSINFPPWTLSCRTPIWASMSAPAATPL